jgi:hypothetical protein
MRLIVYPREKKKKHRRKSGDEMKKKNMRSMHPAMYDEKEMN